MFQFRAMLQIWQCISNSCALTLWTHLQIMFTYTLFGCMDIDGKSFRSEDLKAMTLEQANPDMYRRLENARKAANDNCRFCGRIGVSLIILFILGCIFGCSPKHPSKNATVFLNQHLAQIRETNQAAAKNSLEIKSLSEVIRVAGQDSRNYFRIADDKEMRALKALDYILKHQ